MSARLYVVSGALATGAILAEFARPPWWVLAAWALCGLVCLAAKQPFTGALAVAVVLGCALASLRFGALDHGALAAGARRGADALVEGAVLGDASSDAMATRFTFGVRRAEVDGRPLRVRERLVVTVRPATSVAPGRIVRIDARLSPLLFRGADAAGRAAARRMRHAGIVARAFTTPDGLVDIGPNGNPLQRLADAGRAAVRRAADRMPPRENGLLRGVTIGDTSLLDPVDDANFRTTGLSHIVAVSGANVAYVLAVVAFVLRLARAGRRVTVAVMGVGVIGFVAVARFEPSVMRAGVMAAIALVGIAIGARREATTTLAAATIAMQIADPFVIWSPGFQLSVLATLGLLTLSPRIAALMPPGRLSEAAAITIGAQLAVAPLIAALFHQLSVISVAANLAAVPAVAPATVLGLVAAAGEAIWHPLGVVAVVARAPIGWMLWVARALAQVPLASIGTPAGIAGGAVAFGLGAFAVAVARGRRVRMLPLLLVASTLAASGVWARALGPAPGGLVVTMLNVGQGDAFLVRSNGETMLIDGGPDDRLLVRELIAHHIARIDLLVMTHPHADHIDGLARVAESYPLARALDPAIDATIPAYGAYERALARRRIARDRAAAGMRYVLGAAVVEVLWPPAIRLEGTPEDVNNNSIVLRVRYGAEAILFAGETQEEAQEELLSQPESLRADVLKVSHHGSRHMLPAFYAASRAHIALIPVGPNTFGHPALATLRALDGMRIYRSDRNGEVSVTLTGERLAVRAERAA